MERMCVKFLIIHCMLSVTLAGQDTCANLKKSRKIQAEKLQSMGPDDVALEARYLGRSEGNYRFSVSQSWQLNNGGFGYQDDFLVSTEASGTSIEGCYAGLNAKERYILILKAESGNLYATAPPVSARKYNHRQAVWKKLCGTTKEECRMKISRENLPDTINLYRGMYHFIPCRVESASRVSEIRWLKDGKDIAADGGDIYAANGLYVHNTNLRTGVSGLIIYSAHNMHSGEYTCIATNEDGEIDEVMTQVSVGGAVSHSNYVGCPASMGEYCMNGGTCKALRDLPDALICQCKMGYTGMRCQDAAVSDVSLENVAQENGSLEAQLQQLRMVVGGLAFGVALCLVAVAFIGIAYVKLRKSKPKAIDDRLGSPTQSNVTQVSSLVVEVEEESRHFETVDVEKIPLREADETMTGRDTVVSTGSANQVSIKLAKSEHTRASPRPRLKAQREAISSVGSD